MMPNLPTQDCRMPFFSIYTAPVKAAYVLPGNCGRETGKRPEMTGIEAPDVSRQPEDGVTKELFNMLGNSFSFLNPKCVRSMPAAFYMKMNKTASLIADGLPFLFLKLFAVGDVFGTYYTVSCCTLFVLLLSKTVVCHTKTFFPKCNISCRYEWIKWQLLWRFLDLICGHFLWKLCHSINWISSSFAWREDQTS